MQKREGLYSGRLRKMMLLTFPLLAAAEDATGGELLGPGERAAVKRRSHGSCLVDDTTGAETIEAYAFTGNLYGIDGLNESFLGLRYRRRWFSVAGSWRRVGHPLCDDDEFSLEARADGSMRSPGLHICFNCKRFSPSGFRDQWSGSIEAGLSIGDLLSEYIDSGIEMTAFEPGSDPAASARRGVAGWSMSAGVSAEGVGVAVVIRSSEGRSSTGLMVRSSIGAGSTVRYGYRFEKGEMSTGIMLDRGSFSIDLSCDVHPALGISTGAGVWAVLR